MEKARKRVVLLIFGTGLTNSYEPQIPKNCFRAYVRPWSELYSVSMGRNLGILFRRFFLLASFSASVVAASAQEVVILVGLYVKNRPDLLPLLEDFRAGFASIKADGTLRQLLLGSVGPEFWSLVRVLD